MNLKEPVHLGKEPNPNGPYILGFVGFLFAACLVWYDVQNRITDQGIGLDKVLHVIGDVLNLPR